MKKLLLDVENDHATATVISKEFKMPEKNSEEEANFLSFHVTFFYQFKFQGIRKRFLVNSFA